MRLAQSPLSNPGDRIADIAEGPGCARTGLMHCSLFDNLGGVGEQRVW